jgi:hypothetical protein
VADFINDLRITEAIIIHLVFQAKVYNDKLIWSDWGEVPISISEQEFDQSKANDPAITKKVKVFVLGHEESKLELICKRPYLEIINLNNLTLRKQEWQDNRLAESRIFLSEMLGNISTEYVGFITASCHSKYPQMPHLNDIKAIESQLEPRTVLAAELAGHDWPYHSEQCHKGMMPLLEELSRESGLKLWTGPTFWANNFICSIEIFAEFLSFWRRMFGYFYDKYGFDMPYVSEGFDNRRNAAYFYERFATIFFANRPDLKIAPIANRILRHITTPTKDNLPWIVSDFHNVTEAKFMNKTDAWQYIINRPYLVKEIDVSE